MYDFVIIHGSYGSPFENWFPWLFDELTNKGKNVVCPQFPCGQGIQNFENWEKVLDAYLPFINEKTTFIGHSLAPAFIVDYLLKKELKVDKLLFAAPFYGKIKIPEFDAVNLPFFFNKDFEKIKKNSNTRICYISKTDPYVPNELSLKFANDISAQIKFIENAGHFNKAAGYTKFIELLQDLL